MRLAMSSVLFLALLALTVERASARSLSPPAPPAKYVLAILGDSLSDRGNTFRAASVPDPKVYWNGRFVDGPNWVDYLENAISEKYPLEIFNYAHGGATACAQDALSMAYPFVRNLTSQTAGFVADVAAGKVTVGKKDKLTVVQWVGSNDVLVELIRASATGGALSNAAVTALIQNLVSCRVASASILAQTPGVQAVVLVPISPMHSSPTIPAALKPSVKVLVDLIAQATDAAGARLQSLLVAAGSSVKVHVLGNTSWIEDGFTAISPKYKVLDDTCVISTVTSLTPQPNTTTICANPTDYLFFDDVHPETRFHQWFAIKGFLPRMRKLRLLP